MTLGKPISAIRSEGNNVPYYTLSEYDSFTGIGLKLANSGTTSMNELSSKLGMNGILRNGDEITSLGRRIDLGGKLCVRADSFLDNYNVLMILRRNLLLIGIIRTKKSGRSHYAGKSKPITVHAYFFVYKLVIYELNQATKAFFSSGKDDVPSWLFLLCQNVKEDQER